MTGVFYSFQRPALLCMAMLMYRGCGLIQKVVANPAVSAVSGKQPKYRISISSAAPLNTGDTLPRWCLQLETREDFDAMDYDTRLAQEEKTLEKDVPAKHCSSGELAR